MFSNDVYNNAGDDNLLLRLDWIKLLILLLFRKKEKKKFASFFAFRMCLMCHRHLRCVTDGWLI